jgi:hypothetical protein
MIDLLTASPYEIAQLIMQTDDWNVIRPLLALEAAATNDDYHARLEALEELTGVGFGHRLEG